MLNTSFISGDLDYGGGGCQGFCWGADNSAVEGHKPYWPRHKHIKPNYGLFNCLKPSSGAFWPHCVQYLDGQYGYLHQAIHRDVPEV